MTKISIHIKYRYVIIVDAVSELQERTDRQPTHTTHTHTPHQKGNFVHLEKAILGQNLEETNIFS